MTIVFNHQVKYCYIFFVLRYKTRNEIGFRYPSCIYTSLHDDFRVLGYADSFFPLVIMFYIFLSHDCFSQCLIFCLRFTIKKYCVASIHGITPLCKVKNVFEDKTPNKFFWGNNVKMRFVQNRFLKKMRKFWFLMYFI